MYMNKTLKDVEIYTTECRIVNIKEASDGGIEGTYCQIPTVTIIRDSSLQGAGSNDGLFNIFGEIPPSVFDEYTIVGHIEKYPILGTILEMFKEAEYKCDTNNVKADRIKPRTYSPYKYKDGLWGGDYYGYSYNGYSRSYGYHGSSLYGNGVVHKPKGNSRIVVMKELIGMCPIDISDAEKEHLESILDTRAITYLELREMYSIAYDINEEIIDGEYELMTYGATPTKVPLLSNDDVGEVWDRDEAWYNDWC